jgi:hypothetical protein
MSVMNTSDILGSGQYVLADTRVEEYQTRAKRQPKTIPSMRLTQRLSKLLARSNGEDSAIDLSSESLEELAQGKSAETPWQILFQTVNFPGPEYIGLDILGLAVIGRADPEDGTQPDLDLAPFEAQIHGVSRRHAVLVPTDDGLCLIDLDSSNGTWLNSRYMHPGQKYRLRSGDMIEFGSLKLMIRVIGVTAQGLSINPSAQARVRSLHR